MRTPKDFDYDLWTTKNGKNMVRVKATGEVTEVSRKLMRVLRAIEMKHKRSKTGVPIDGCEDERATLLSLDFVSIDNNGEGCDGMTPGWLIDRHDYIDDLETYLAEEELKKELTDVQLEVYVSCIRGGQTPTDFAKQHGIARQSVEDSIDLIRKKSKNFFE